MNTNLIKNSGAILVNKNAEDVFDFFANPCNDNLWRTEINKSLLDGPLQVGVTVSEYSYLSKKESNNLLELKCVQFEKNKIAVFETPDNPKFYLRSQRLVKAVSDNTTELIYKLDFDKSIVKFAVGFSLPNFIISLKAGSDMKKYLRQLKKQLESV
ncbi:SRPBCC family protein [Larkinella harenae]